MSYALAAALQTSVFQALETDVALSSLIGGAVYDELPEGVAPNTYVILGAETTLDRSDADGDGAEHRLAISVFSSAGGFAQGKQVAAAVSDVLHRADLVLSRGRMVFMTFEKAVARRDTVSGLRRIDLKFRARVEDDLIS